MATLVAGAGAAGAGAVTVAGGVVGITSGPLLPQPASVATKQQSGSSKRDRRMVGFPVLEDPV
jgi:hypothetical protein